MNDGPNGVTFTTKEMLLQLDMKIDAIDAKLDRKVDRDDFQRIASRVEQAADRAAVAALESRFTALETQVRTQDKINEALRVRASEVAEASATNFTRGEKVIATLLALTALTIQILAVTGVIS